MSNARVLSLLFAAGLCAATGLRAETDFHSGPERVALIELYTSEGCSSCPPAEKWLGTLSSDPALWKRFVPVAFHVNYWDQLGWKDVFSTPEFTQREYRYADAWKSSSVYTPCFVRNGMEWRPDGGSPVSSVVKKAAAGAGELSLKQEAAGEWRVEFKPAIGAPLKARQLEVSLAILGAGIVSPVRAGENSGRELRHEFIALAMKTATLTLAEDGSYSAHVTLPPPATKGLPAVPRKAVAGWITAHGDQVPLQATGGWL